jgi:hypothetical protein
LGENKIFAITFPAHSTDLFQALDLVFFAALQKLKATVVAEFGDESLNAEITTVIQTYEQSVTSATIKGDATPPPFKVRVAEARVRENPEFQEVRELTISIETLSRHPRDARNTDWSFVPC